MQRELLQHGVQYSAKRILVRRAATSSVRRILLAGGAGRGLPTNWYPLLWFRAARGAAAIGKYNAALRPTRQPRSIPQSAGISGAACRCKTASGKRAQDLPLLCQAGGVAVKVISAMTRRPSAMWPPTQALRGPSAGWTPRRCAIEQALAETAEKCTVFGRGTPEQKRQFRPRLAGRKDQRSP